MTPDALLQMYSQPDVLRQVSLTDLKRTVEAFPCFAMARMLYVKKLKEYNDLDFTDELFKASLASPNRRQLFFCIRGMQGMDGLYETPYAEEMNPYGEQRPVSSPSENAVEEGNGFLLIDRFLDSYREKAMVARDIPLTETNVYSIEESLGDGSDVEEENELVRDFLKNPDNETLSEESKATDGEVLPPVVEEGYLPQAAFTLTLARIYIRQKKYERALEILRSILLKNPEKSIYFADQIRYLEKVINHLNQ